MASMSRESSRMKLQGQRQVDEAVRSRRRRKQLEQLEADNYQEDPHSDIKLKKKTPKFASDTGTSTDGSNLSKSRSSVSKRKKGRGEDISLRKPRYRKNFQALLDEEQLYRKDMPCYSSARAKQPNKPARKFCAVCGCFAPYTCIPCGARYCSVRCSETHKETRCQKWVS